MKHRERGWHPVTKPIPAKATYVEFSNADHTLTWTTHFALGTTPEPVDLPFPPTPATHWRRAK